MAPEQLTRELVLLKILFCLFVSAKAKDGIDLKTDINIWCSELMLILSAFYLLQALKAKKKRRTEKNEVFHYLLWGFCFSYLFHVFDV